MKRIILLIVLIAMVFSGCRQKKMTHAEMMKNAPSWVTQTPNNPMFYHGVGMAVKNPGQDFRERARQNALAEVASGISVNVSSSSVLNQFQFDNTYSEFFRDNIRISAQQQLEGYELVETWENDHQFWTYYRLSKATHQRIRQERINSAMRLSVSRFEQARNLANQGRMAESIGFFIQSVEGLGDFIGEELVTEIDGDQQIYSTLLMSEMTGQLNSLIFDYPFEALQVKPGSGNVAPFDVFVRDAAGRPVSGVPVQIRFSWAPGNIFEAQTDSRGSFRISPTRIRPGRTNESITCNIDIRSIAASNSSDPSVRRLFAGFTIQRFVLPVDVVAPVMVINTESEHGRSHLSSTVNEISRLLSNDGVKVSQNINESDFSLKLEVVTMGKAQTGNRFTHHLRTTVTVADRSGRVVFNSGNEDVTGLGANENAALEDAFNALLGKIRITIHPNMVRELFAGS